MGKVRTPVLTTHECTRSRIGANLTDVDGMHAPQVESQALTFTESWLPLIKSLCHSQQSTTKSLVGTSSTASEAGAGSNCRGNVGEDCGGRGYDDRGAGEGQSHDRLPIMFLLNSGVCAKEKNLCRHQLQHSRKLQHPQHPNRQQPANLHIHYNYNSP